MNKNQILDGSLLFPVLNGHFTVDEVMYEFIFDNLMDTEGALTLTNRLKKPRRQEVE